MVLQIHNTWISIPALPWTAVVIGAIIIGYKLGGIRLALLAGIGFFYVSVFGQWEPSMQTLSLILFTAPVCFIIGLSLGVWGYLSKRVEAGTSANFKCCSNNATFFILSSYCCIIWSW